jgi:hypothetical protein
MTRILFILLPRSLRYSRNPFQCLDRPVARQQRYREPSELLPLDIVHGIVKRPERNQVIDGQRDVGLQGIETLLGHAVERRLGVLAFQIP